MCDEEYTEFQSYDDAFDAGFRLGKKSTELDTLRAQLAEAKELVEESECTRCNGLEAYNTRPPGASEWTRVPCPVCQRRRAFIDGGEGGSNDHT